MRNEDLFKLKLSTISSSSHNLKVDNGEVNKPGCGNDQINDGVNEGSLATKKTVPCFAVVIIHFECEIPGNYGLQSFANRSYHQPPSHPFPKK